MSLPPSLKLPFRAVLWSVALAALGYLGLSLWAGWREVVAAVVQVGPLVLIGLLVLFDASPSHTFNMADMRAGALAAFRQLTEVLLANCEDVGADFAEEARRIHYVEAPERSIRGEASAEEYEALLEEGIEVFRLARLKPGDMH